MFFLFFNISSRLTLTEPQTSLWISIYIYTGWLKKTPDLNYSNFSYFLALISTCYISIERSSEDLLYGQIHYWKLLIFSRIITITWSNFILKQSLIMTGFTEYIQMRYIHSAWSPLLSARQWALCVLYFAHLSTSRKVMFWRQIENSR